MPEPEVLSRELLDDALNRLPGWTTDGNQIQHDVQLDDEQHAAIAAHVDEVQTAMNHHADVDRDGQTTKFTLSTHSAGGVTVLDLKLASEIDSACRLRTGEEPQHPPEELMGTHTIRSEPTEGQDPPGAESKARTADLVADVQGTQGQTGEADSAGTTAAASGGTTSAASGGTTDADSTGGGAHRADGTGSTTEHRAEPSGRREVWAENPSDETSTASAEGSDTPEQHAEDEQSRQREWELEEEGGARGHDPYFPKERD